MPKSLFPGGTILLTIHTEDVNLCPFAFLRFPLSKIFNQPQGHILLSGAYN